MNKQENLENDPLVPLETLAKNDSMGIFLSLLSVILQETNDGFLASSIRHAIENIEDPVFRNKYGRFIPFFQVLLTQITH